MKPFTTSLSVSYLTSDGKPRRTSYRVVFLSHVDGRIKFYEGGDLLPNGKACRRRCCHVDSGLSRPDFYLEVQRYLTKTLKTSSEDIDVALQQRPSWWK